MSIPRLYMLLLGCRPEGRLTEQHDIFFGIACSIKELIPAIKDFWPEAKGAMHIDAWREVTQVGEFSITVEEGERMKHTDEIQQLFFINLGGYKMGEFDEFHYKTLIVAENKSVAIKLAKQTAFYKHVGFKTAPSHIDDKYGVDVDDILEIQEILPQIFKDKYHLKIIKEHEKEDEIHLGYFTLDKFK